MGNPLVSVIIPTRNSSKTLKSSIISIRSQSYKPIEIVVVDNHSTDNTIKIARKYADKVYIKGPERSNQRNYGVKKANGKYLLWIDSDMELTTDVVEECIDTIKKSDYKALILPEKSVGNNFWAKCRALEKTCYLGDKQIEAIRFTDRNTFNKVGGFTSKFISGEDWNITIKTRNKGLKIGRIKSYVLHNEGKLSLAKDIQKKYYYATTSLPYIHEHVRKPIDILLFVLRPAFFRNWKILLLNPVLTGGLLFMKSLEFMAGFIGISKAYIKRKKRLYN